MFQRRRPLRSVPRTRSLALGGALAALAVVGGGTVVAVSGPTDVAEGDIVLTQNAPAQEMELGAPVDLDLEPVVAAAAGGVVPEGTTVQVTGLPDGLVQNGWVISGTPTRAGEYDVLITVSNSGESRSERVTIVVTEEGGGAGGPAVSGEPTASETTDESATPTEETTAPGATRDGETDAGPGATTEDQATTDGRATETEATRAGEPDPTLSAVPGRGAAGEGQDVQPGGEGAEAVTPELCALFGGDVGGQLDATALAANLAPMLSGGEDEAGTSGMAGMILTAVAGLLPSLLGATGSADDTGSAGQMLCSLPLTLLDGGGAETAVPTDEGAVPTDEAAGAAGTQALTADDGAGDGLAAQAATAAGLSGFPSALVGLLGAETGSLDG